ncbi:DUF2797 domain-containing protein [Faecalicatena sp. BF-R-105]|nr:DUF2797 domain-containing protein [Faecalicatena sp. BF-R-105]
MSDLISRETLKSRLEDFSEWCRDGRKQGIDFVLDCPLPNMESVDAAPVTHGRWIRLQHSGEIVCSNCGRRLRKNGGNDYADCEPFCPNCGADMREVDNG